jgi:glucose-1-phosphate thymidylyltransferase
MSAQPVKALILAGGKGTRLRPLTYAMAKQLVPVANKPILYYGLDEIYQAGVRDFGIIISPETGDAIEGAVKAWQPADARVTFIPQAQPLGLAHAVKTAQPYLGDSDFIMYLGDNLINVQLSRLVEEFQETESDAFILLKEVENPSSFGVAELDDNGQVIRLVEKPKEPKSNLALIGVYLFKSVVFQAIDSIKPSWRNELEITDAIQWLIDHQHPVRSTIHSGWWLDTGKKDDLLAANRTVLSDFVESANLGSVDSRSQLIGNVDIGHDSTLQNCRVTGPVRIGDDCYLANVTIGPYTSIGDGCRLSDCTVENSVLLEQCTIAEVKAPIRESLLGQGCKIVAEAEETPAAYHFLLADHSEIRVP